MTDKTVDEIADELKGELSVAFADGNKLLPGSVEHVVSNWLAVQLRGILVKQQLKGTTPLSVSGSDLDEWGAVMGCARPQATKSSGFVTVVSEIAGIIPSGTILSGCNGVEYVTTADAVFTIAGDTIDIPVTSTDTGSHTNLPPEYKVNIDSTVASFGVVSTQGIGGGANTVTDDEVYRQLVLSKIRSCRGNVSMQSIDNYALQFPGVTSAWTLGAYNGCGTAKTFFMTDHGIPFPIEVDALQSHLYGTDDGYGRRGGVVPAGIVGTVCAPTEFLVNITVTGAGLGVAETLEAESILDDTIQALGIPGQDLCLVDINVAMRQIQPALCLSAVFTDFPVDIALPIPHDSFPSLGATTWL